MSRKPSRHQNSITVPPPCSPPSKRGDENGPRRRAATLVELLIALLITSLLALGVASIVYAVSYGTSSQRDLRRIAVRGEQLRTRLDDAIRHARSVLASGEDVGGEKYLVLWKGDSNTDDENQVNLSELQLIGWDPATDEITSYETSGTVSPDTAYAAGSNFYNVADAARTSGDLVGTLWAGDISAFEVTLDEAVPTDARVVTWRATVTDQLLTEDIAGTATLRSPGAPE